MAQQASVAFGSYLRTLRERLGLSLQSVCRLSETSAKAIDKGTLSRFERGQQRLALAHVIPLSRIYQIPTQVLVERLELDIELERRGGPDTDGHSRDELCDLGRDFLVGENHKWEAYAAFRDALDAPDDGRLSGAEEVESAARINLATVQHSLGKSRLALHEFEELERSIVGSPVRRAVILDRISNCYRVQGRYDEAERYVQAAIAETNHHKNKRVLAYAYLSRAALAIERRDHDAAAEFLRRAFRANREAGRQTTTPRLSPVFEVDTLLKLGDVYYRSGYYERAKRSALGAKKLATRDGLPAALGYAEIALGELDERSGLDERAQTRWLRAADLAESVDNRRLGFCAEFYIFRQALRRGNHGLARASRQRLERAAPWIPEHIAPLREFKELVAEAPRGIRSAG